MSYSQNASINSTMPPRPPVGMQSGASQPPPTNATSSSVGTASSTSAPAPIVRVMRLSKPGLLSLSTSSSTIGALQSLHAPERASIITDFPLTPHLLLPEAFGDIYVGEEFSAYVSVVNGATSADAGYGAGDGYHSFAMSLHLLSPSATVELLDNRPAEGVVADPLGAHTTITPPLLAPGQRVDATVRTLLAELGMHTLRVTVLYRQAGQQGVLSEAKTMRKFYKFNVLPPLRISTSVRAFAWNRSAEAGSYLSVQSCVTNLTDMQLMLESVNLVVTDGDAVVLPAAGEQLSFGGPSGDPAVSPALRTAQAVNALLLQAQEAYAVSFVVRLPAAAIAAESIGRVDASWCLLMGQRGLLQSTPVRLLDARPEKQVSGTPSLSMHLQHCPATVILGQPFEVLVRVCSAAPLQQQLQVLLEANPISDSTGLCAVGRSRLALAAFTKASEQDVSVTYIAQRPGLCAVHMQLIGANPRSGAGAEEQLLCAATVLGQVFVKAAE